MPTEVSLSIIVQGFVTKAINKFAKDGFSIQIIWVDNAVEKFTHELESFCQSNGIQFEPSPSHAPESNGAAERLVKEHWTWERVMMIATNLPL